MSSAAAPESLTVRECWSCLAATPVGRLAYLDHGRPAVRPVNFSVADGCVVVWSRPGAKARALRGQTVAFQADQLDNDLGTGRSVVVTGAVSIVSDEDESVSSIEPVRRPWATGPLDHVVRIRIQRVAGSRWSLPDTHSAARTRGGQPAGRDRPDAAAPAGSRAWGELGTAECWARLSTAAVSRLVHLDHGLPTIYPVTVTTAGDRLAVRPVAGGSTGLVPGDAVAVEADEIDPRTRTAWSVVLSGTAETIPATGGIGIRANTITGRLVRPVGETGRQPRESWW